MLQTTHQQMLRVLMMGKACKKSYEGGQRKYKSISYVEVCRVLERPTIDVVLRASRLKFLQTLTAKPQHHQLVWCCLIGKYEFEEQQVGNPWSNQFCLDILELKNFDGLETLCSCMQEAYDKHGGLALKILLDNKECKT